MQTWLGSTLQSYKFVFLLYVVLLLALFFPYVVLGEVISPHRQAKDMGVGEPNGSSLPIENRKFSDFTNSYIPETVGHVSGKRSGWLVLWSNENELGRPLSHMSGFSPAYSPSWVLTKFIQNPWRLITVLSLLTSFLAGFFVILYCREIGLHPLAALVSGISLAASPQFMYWLSFPMFTAVYCWSAGALWAVTRLSKKITLLSWSVLTFSGYSLLMVAYPQTVIYHMYLLGGYGIFLIYSMRRQGYRKITNFIGAVFLALAIGSILAIPIYRDLLILSSESARVDPDTSFFTSVLPHLHALPETMQFLVFSTVPEFFGNPIAPEFPFPYNGLSVTLLAVFFAVLGLFSSFRNNWGWWLSILIIGLFTFLPSFYVMGINYLGFNLSSTTPLGAVALPLTWVIASGVDAAMHAAYSPQKARWIILAAAFTFGILLMGILYGQTQALPIQEGVVLTMGLTITLLAFQYRRPSPLLILLALVITVAVTSYPLILHQPMDEIITTSPLVELVQKKLPAQSRFAVAAPGIVELPPNLNATLGLPSLHSYNSLSSSRYHVLIEALGGQVKNYGRSNRFIAPEYSSAMFWMSNVGLVLAPRQMLDPNLEFVGVESDVYVYKVLSRMGPALQIIDVRPVGVEEDGRVPIIDPRSQVTHTPIKTLDEGDVLEFKVSATSASILVLSQKYHRDWHARVQMEGDWVVAPTLAVNGVFQGVTLPQNVERVRLEFKPWVRYAWVAHVFWLFLFAALILNSGSALHGWQLKTTPRKHP